LKTIRLIIVIAAQHRWELYQMVSNQHFLMVFWNRRFTLSNLWDMKRRDMNTRY
jgi:hypothetical protein